ncbi:MAG TPA: helix-turn-helix domain-containing protein [Bryobacteraceae bacterium]|nr:helix-turn-helix domain-containing protein [Bryobacteraceae bacterium]
MLRHHRPGFPLSDFVECFWTFDGFQQAHAKERIMPDGALTLVVNLNEDRTRIYDRRDFDRCETFNGSLLVGPQTEFFVIDTAEQLSVAGIQFKPGGAFPFFDPPPDELQGLQVPLDALWGGFAGDFREKLLRAGTGQAAFEVIETALLARLQKPDRHPAVTYALGKFMNEPHVARVADVIDETGFSARRFIQLFREQAGLAPKVFCRVQRFQRALRRIVSGSEVEWAEVALEAGYFDQSHFIHDFRAFSGINPTAYRCAKPRHINHVPIPD